MAGGTAAMSEASGTQASMEDGRTAVSLTAIIECLAQPVWVVDHEGRVVFANRAAVVTLGYEDAAELRGRQSHETIHYKHRDGSPYAVEDCPLARAVVAGETLISEEEWFVRRDGSMFPVSYMSAPIDLPGGRGTVVAFTDIEDRLRAEQALREREAILAKVAQPVWVVDHAGRFHYANPAALAALGYDDLSELKGKPGHATVHYKYPDGTPFPEEDCPVTRARLTGETLTEREDWLVRKDGSILRISFATAPFDLPDGPGSVTAFTDVEEQLRAERAARERDVAEARAEELRIARRRVIEAADAARARLERDLHDGAQQQLVNAALRLRLARNRLPAEPDTAAQLLDDAIEQTNAAIAELRELAAGIHPGVLTHRGLGPALERLAARQPLPVTVLETPTARLPAPVEASVYFLVSEALTNVVKHAQATGATIRAGEEGGRLVVEVRDDGIGGAARRPGGTGLAGLSDRVAALEGELAVVSPPGVGTTLRAEIPLHACEAPAAS
jgi:PAS domain S-box-containing protein